MQAAWETSNCQKPVIPAERSNLLGVRVDLVSLNQVSELFQNPRSTLLSPLQIVTLNVNFLTLARKYSGLAAIFNSAGLVVADGRILLWLLRLLGAQAPDQITGHDLFELAVDRASRDGAGVFLLGGAEGVAERLAKRLQERFPSARFFGTHHGDFNLDGNTHGNPELIAQIRSFDPTYLFVALGCPKQERWISANLKAADVPITVGVGCVFDVADGDLPRAPEWVQLAGLESGFQILIAPRRYARRYIFEDPPTVVAALREIWRRRFSRATNKDAAPDN
jgi:N-acetylglucosaminyldiphosphoundecaprenol N-acetyl-beta-D-mannosaminyltransferase